MTDLHQAVMQAKTPLEYLRAEVALLRDMDDTSGDADWMEKAKDDLERLAERCASYVGQVECQVAEIERLRALLDEATTNPEGDYYLGLRCGVEDRDIYDRYEAAEYGWEQAFEYVASVAGPASSDSERIPEGSKGD